MAYITINELDQDYGAREITQLSVKDGSDVRDVGRVQSCIDRGASRLDALLSKCYVLPLVMADGSPLTPSVLMLLRDWNGCYARFLLTDDGRLGGSADSAPTETRARYLEIKKSLEALNPDKKGGCLLVPGVKLLDSTVDAASATPNVHFGDSGRVFGREADSAEFRDREFP